MAADPQAAPVRAPDQSAVSAVHPRAPSEPPPDARRTERAALHPVAQVFDQVGDWIAVLGLTYACIAGRLSGELLLVGVCVVLGVQTGLRRGLGPKGLPGAGAVALLVFSLAQLFSAGAHSHAGYVRLPRVVRRGLRWLLTALACVSIAGCELPKPDGCTPRDTRCSPSGIPEVCSSTQRWTHGATTPACSTWGASITCCLARTPYDGVRHACVPPVACIPETPSAAPDAGAESGAL